MNADRHLVAQGFNTNINHTLNFSISLKDTVAYRLIMEVHYYDPHNFTLNTKSSISQWSSIATDSITLDQGVTRAPQEVPLGCKQ
jgi:endoglucanase